MRAFIGIDFSRELKDRIAGMQSELRSMASAGRWKYIDNFHLTLKFLDDINKEQTAGIDRQLKEICSRTSRFSLRVSELGNFPGRGCLRVLWLGLDGELDKLFSLQGEVDAQLQGLGFEKENRRYTPHVTIGQDIVFDRDFAGIRQMVDFKTFPEVNADRLYLFKSEQIGNKRVYTPVHEYRLL